MAYSNLFRSVMLLILASFLLVIICGCETMNAFNSGKVSMDDVCQIAQLGSTSADDPFYKIFGKDGVPVNTWFKENFW